jgi:hypothetical protein
MNQKMNHAAHKKKSARFNIKKIPISIFIVLIILLGIRIAIPPVAMTYINKYLANGLKDYTGSIEDFDLSLYRGAYQVKGFEMRKKANPSIPFIRVQKIDFSVAWRALFHKKILLDAMLNEPEINLIQSKSKAKKVTGKEEKPTSWKKIADILAPLDVESFEIANGRINFSDYDLKAPVLMKISKINIIVANIKNTEGTTEKLPSTLKATALVQNDAELSAKGRFNILKESPDIDGEASLENFKLKEANSLLLSYLPLSFNKGTFSMTSKIKSNDGKLTGFVKPEFKDVDVVSPKETFKSLKHIGIELAVSAGNLIFRNAEDHSVLTQIEIGGTLRHPKIFTPEWLSVAWENAFGNPLPKGFQKINLK